MRAATNIHFDTFKRYMNLPEQLINIIKRNYIMPRRTLSNLVFVDRNIFLYLSNKCTSTGFKKTIELISESTLKISMLAWIAKTMQHPIGHLKF